MQPSFWQGEETSLQFSNEGYKAILSQLKQPVFAVRVGERIGLTNKGEWQRNGPHALIGFAPPVLPETLGDESFRRTYGTRYAYYAGAMANGIASAELVIAMGQAGFLASFGAGGLSLARIESAIQQVQAALPQGPYAFNLLHSPMEPLVEENVVDLYLKYRIPVVEASAYINITPALVRYRVSGLTRRPDGQIQIAHRVIAKLSRLEVAQKFLAPPPEKMLQELLSQGKITPEQAELARHVPLADDITVEADSGGHTDNRPLVVMFPAFLRLRDEIQSQATPQARTRIGAAGGIGTPQAVLAALMLGAAYVATGSINQACVEAGTSEKVKNLLAQMSMTDVIMAPAGDMFEMGVRVQVLKRGTMFAMRAQKLYELYTRYNAWEEIPAEEREKLEKTIFKRDFESIWRDTVEFFRERDPRQIERGEKNPKDKMALVFRWYLGLSSRWAIQGEDGREMDYQVWAGPAMGAFNAWVKGTPLEQPSNRRVVEVAHALLNGCAYLMRVRLLELQGVRLPPETTQPPLLLTP
ncbi:MAG: PfaD family polyunsaturated fatty acid/polyketide biosynthesis protein [Anaerolineales bacterium]|nr:PfaD family polyunsaturated fatty acid/polyketide biosynthesis protein [Anaerolineales bacterium]